MSESSRYRVETAWRVVENPNHFVVLDASGVALAHIAFNPNLRPNVAPGQMTRTEALSVAQGMVADQDKKVAISRASEMIASSQHEPGGINRRNH